jgi:hypothetical protein
VTLEERVEWLAGRHEALTQTVELMVQEHREFQRRMEALTQMVELMVEEHRKFKQRMTQYSAGVKDAIARLANIAAAHDDTIDDHERGIENLER